VKPIRSCDKANNGVVASFRLLAVFSHPDDETVVAPLLAKSAREGHSVHLLTLTAGEKGIREHAKIPAGEALASVRAQELACSAAALGITGHTLLRFPDQGFSAESKSPIWKDAVSEIRAAIGRFRPDVIVTWGPEGGTGHPDHRVTNSLVVQAFQQRSLLSHQPRKLYYGAFVEPASTRADDWASETRVSREFITTDVDCSEYVEAAQRSIECYRSQWTPELMRRIPDITRLEHGHVHLRLAYSTVTSRVPETDIFDGL
jgi:LmbE family N-acetylglucosaminyl deacetylase